MLNSTLLLETPRLRVRDVHCAHCRGGWAAVEASSRSGIVFARRGAFRRRGSHGEQVIEPGVAYFQRAGDEEEYAHPYDGGDRCTSVAVEDSLLASLLGGDPTLPFATTPHADLSHRLLSSDASEEGTIGLLASVLGAIAPVRVASGRPATALARRRIAGDAREALAADSGLGLVELAQAVAVSPHHLSRVFRSEVGVTVTAYRRRLRVRGALERLAGGEGDLARLAADAGFADHAHLTREVRALLGTTPSALERRLSQPLVVKVDTR